MEPDDDGAVERDRARGRAVIEALLGDASTATGSRADRARALAEGIVWLRGKLSDARLL